jgi:hypothetical protein
MDMLHHPLNLVFNLNTFKIEQMKTSVQMLLHYKSDHHTGNTIFKMMTRAN